MRTLLEVEPRTPLNSLTGNDQYAIVISQSGSYYLTGDITVAGKHGLAIGADHVTIDLNGFTFRGPGNLTAIGLVAQNDRTNFVLRNGTLANWGYASLGIAGHMRDCLFEDLTLIDNIAGGLELPSVDNSVFRNIRVRGQGEAGIVGGNNCVIEGCCVDGVSSGISAVFNTVVSNCTVIDCGVGVHLFAAGVIEGCTARACGTGFDIGSSCTIRGSSASGCGTGILAESFGRVESCLVVFSSVSAIRSRQNTTIVSCSLMNSPIGVHIENVLGGGALIDSNAITSCPIGIKVDSAENTIVRNIISDSSTAATVLAPGNRVGTMQSSPIGAGAWDNFDF